MTISIAKNAGFPLLNSCRMHEVCGPSALSFALIMAAQSTGAIMYVDSEHQNERLHPLGVGQFVDISRLLVSYGAVHKDKLWVAEEALRSGCVPVVIARLDETIDLTAGRRLQLAAKAGKSMGLFILPQGMGSNVAETRWLCTPVSADLGQLDSTLFEWSCIKNKTGTTNSWLVRWNETTHHIDILSQAGNGSLSQVAVC